MVCFKITKGVMSIKDRAFQKCDIFRDVSPTLLLLSIESTKINFEEGIWYSMMQQKTKIIKKYIYLLLFLLCGRRLNNLKLLLFFL